ncbi:MAG: RNA ligase family protein [bacterium]|nr:RNA ligase family protein [bacterium]
MPRIKLAYPKIPDSRAAPLEKCIAFEKYDGTNLHWVWEPELGWYAFGTRRNRFDLDDRGIAAFTEDHPELAQAPALFLDEFAAPLQSTLLSRPDFATREVTVFTEFLGPRSFAGRHNADDDKQLILFDVAIENQLLGPAQFLEDFGHLPVARVVYRGRFTGQFTSDVRAGKYAVAEGVICKGGTGPSLWMAKIKTDAYLARLKTAFADNWEQYWE